MRNFYTKFMGVLVFMLTAMTTAVLGGNNTYYSKMTATSTGNGSVYVNTTNSDSGATYAEEDTKTRNSSASSAPSHTYYLFAQAEEGFAFDGWYATADCTGEPASKANPYQAGVNATSTNSANPSEGHFYAKFVAAEEAGEKLRFTIQADPTQINYVRGGDPEVDFALLLPKLSISAEGALNEVDYEGEWYMLYVSPIDEYEYSVNVYNADGDLVMSPIDNSNTPQSVVVATSVLQNGKVEIISQEKSAAQNCVVTFEPNLDAISKVLIGSEEVTVADKQLTTKTGNVLSLRPDPDYTVSKVEANGVEVEFLMGAGAYVLTLTEAEVTVVITAQHNSEVKQDVALEVADNSAIKVYLSSSRFEKGTEIEVADIITAVGATPFVQIEAAEGNNILSAKYVDVDGVEGEMEFDSWAKYYYVNVVEKKVASIAVATETVSYEPVTATIWIEDVSKFSDYYIRTSDKKFPFDYESALYLTNGDNTLEITANQNPVRLNFTFQEGYDVVNYVFLNDEQLEMKVSEEDNVLWGDVTIANGDVLKIFISESTATGINATQDVTSEKHFDLQGRSVVRGKGLGIVVKQMSDGTRKVVKSINR